MKEPELWQLKIMSKVVSMEKNEGFIAKNDPCSVEGCSGESVPCRRGIDPEQMQVIGVHRALSED
ncbi:hypothetical protein BJQ90_00219 [Arthrobacter sp. SO3]|nr:hypothetical protein [Arthrobacter sp. SO3]